MGKKKKDNPLGKSLIKDRFSQTRNRRQHADSSMIHSTDLNDGYDWGRLNLQSVTEESSFQEFLSTAELAGTEFEAEKLNLKFVKPVTQGALQRQGDSGKDKQKTLLTIPRRPKWNENTTAAELDAAEKESFLEWRRGLAVLQEEQNLLLTPYEKTLEFWRQLWRVTERSDVVVQILDARNPLLFRCEDLESYVKELSADKQNMLLINKADFLTEDQRQGWAEYFNQQQIKVVFFSATAETADTDEETLPEQLDDVLNLDDDKIVNVRRILSHGELVKFFRLCHKAPRVTEGKTTVGLVGYPNVGKSSTVNSLLVAKKVAVSATPGKTKHFQTFNLEEDLILCDCPGLVMPSYVSTKSDMVVSGILPIDQMRDHVPPVSLVASLIPRHVLESTYGFILPNPLEGEDPQRPPTSEELLNAFGYNRGFMTQNGQPDNPRSSRYILKDFVNGKLLYCYAPPGQDQQKFHQFPERSSHRDMTHADPRYVRAVRAITTTTEDIDKAFFMRNSLGSHSKGVRKVLMTSQISDKDAETLVQNHSGSKPWKEINKHVNKKKKEKLRRVYAQLDEH